MTKRLYLQDNYLKKFKARITNITEKGIVLDQTVFYPEGGGQPGDRGELNVQGEKIRITNTKVRHGQVVHEISRHDIPLNAEVSVQLDWDYRYRLMQSHTAQHVISRFFQNHYNADTVSTQLKGNKSRLDFHPLPKITKTELSSIEEKINDILKENLPVTVATLPREEAFTFLKEKDYQTKYLEMIPKSIKEIRIISIGNYDFASCGGTHVRNTSEIGKITLISTKNKGKLRERIFYSVN